MSTERQSSVPFARSRASKKHSGGKPLSPAQMRERSLAQNKATALEQAQMRERKVAISGAFQRALHGSAYMMEFRLKMCQLRGQFKGGIAV